MSSLWTSPEHRARELLNLVHLSERCASLPDIQPAERRRWEVETRRAWEALQTLLPDLSQRGRAAQELTAQASRVATELDLPLVPAVNAP